MSKKKKVSEAGDNDGSYNSSNSNQNNNSKLQRDVAMYGATTESDGALTPAHVSIQFEQSPSTPAQRQAGRSSPQRYADTSSLSADQSRFARSRDMGSHQQLIVSEQRNEVDGRDNPAYSGAK